MASVSTLPAHRWLSEPLLAFHPERDEDSHVHPLEGLLEYGPYSRSLMSQVYDPLRVAAIYPFGMGRRIDGLLKEMEQQHLPQERRAYLRPFPGFSRVFGLRVVRAPDGVQVELPSSLGGEIARSKQPHQLLAERLTQALSSLQSQRNEFDLVMILLPDEWQGCFRGGADEDFDLHDYLKAITAARGLPMQIVVEGGALKYHCRASVMWRLGIAMYCKAGGVPWKLAHTDPETAFVGISYALRLDDAGRMRFWTCCSQVFDADGAGLEFLAYEPDGIRVEHDNPYLNRTEMRRVMARSLALYQKRHTGRKPKRVIVHKTTPFQHDEVDGCFDAWSGIEGLELIQVQQDVPWRGIHYEAPSNAGQPVPGNYPCLRGSQVALGGRDVLLWTQGDAPTAVGSGHFYKEGKGIPSPLLMTRFAGHGSWDDNSRSVLALSKMNWNNDSLYDRLPVTMSYAGILARTLKRMPQLSPLPYQFRYFM